MIAPAATLATFADFRIVKTRKLAQFVFELPIEKADEALAALGGLPRSDDERWCGIALVNSAGHATATASSTKVEEAGHSAAPDNAGQSRDKPRRHFSEMPRSQQAGMLCADPRFRDWLGVDTHDEAADKVRERCKVKSRADLDNYKAFPIPAGKWDTLVIAYHAETGQMAEIR